MKESQTHLTRADIERILRDDWDAAHVRDLATTALGLMDRDNERKTIIDDALASSLERAEAHISRLGEALRAIENLAHLAWLDTSNIEALFRMIEQRAKDALSVTEEK